MKKVLIMTAAITVLAFVNGCVSAKASTRVKNPDGVQTESSAAVWGWGDKTAQLAAEGLFADGTVEDLGAGFKTTSASQESTGVAQSITALTQLLQAAGEVKAPMAVKSLAVAPDAPCPTCSPCETPPSTR